MSKVSTSYYRAPVSAALTSAAGVTTRLVLSSSSEVESAFRAQRSALVSRGYAGKSVMGPIAVTRITERACLLQAKGTRYKGTGDEVLEHIDASYLAELFDEDGYRFTALWAEVTNP